VPEFGPKKIRPLYVDNSLLNIMPYVQFIVKQMKCTLTGRGIARISADALFLMLQKKIGLEIHVPGVNLLLQVSQFFTFISFIYPIY